MSDEISAHARWLRLLLARVATAPRTSTGPVSYYASVLMTLACATAAPGQQTLNGQIAVEEKTADPRTPFGASGFVDLKYLGRWTEHAHDNDLHAYASIRFGDEDADTVTAYVAGRGAWDLDRNRDPSHPFRTVDDTYSKDVTGRLFSAYADLNGVEGALFDGVLRRVRLGRQTFYETPQTLFLDGLSVETVPAPQLADLVFTAYVGVPSNLFESSPSGDWSTGAALSVEPWRAGRLRFDYMHITDDYLSMTSHDDLFGVRFDQSIARALALNAHLNILEGDARDLGAGASWSDFEADLTLTARYAALFSDENRHSITLDYYTPLIQTYTAYHQWEIAGHKGLGDFYVEAGLQWRKLDQNSTEGVFNHEFQRYHASPGLIGWPWRGSDVSATFELWDASGDRFTAFGADFTQEFDERWRASGRHRVRAVPLRRADRPGTRRRAGELRQAGVPTLRRSPPARWLRVRGWRHRGLRDPDPEREVRLLMTITSRPPTPPRRPSLLRRAALVLGLALLATACQAVYSMFGGGARGPVYPHVVHLEEALDCVDCHDGAEDRADAGFPASARGCMLCHEELDEGKPVAHTVAAFLVEGKPTWLKRTPAYDGEVVFDHAAHFTAEVDCEVCHGPQAGEGGSDLRLHGGKARCMECHDRNRARQRLRSVPPEPAAGRGRPPTTPPAGIACTASTPTP